MRCTTAADNGDISTVVYIFGRVIFEWNNQRIAERRRNAVLTTTPMDSWLDGNGFVLLYISYDRLWNVGVAEPHVPDNVRGSPRAPFSAAI